MPALTAREYDRKIDELIASIKAQALPFAEADPLSIARRSARALADYDFFARTYFPHYITAPSAPFHQEMLDLTQRPKTITAVAAPRGHGKTVHLAIIRPLWRILQGSIHFFVAVAENEDLARERTAAIAAELAYNQRLLMDFDPSLPAVWADEDFIARNSCRCLSLGYKQPIRGKFYGPWRPDYIVIDDFESHSAFNPRIARAKKDYVRQEAFGALPHDDRGSVIWLGNLTHADSALNLFKQDCEDEPDNPQINFLLYKAILEDGTPLWPQAYSLQALQTIRDAMGSIGFERHYLMNPIVEGVKFLNAWLRTWSDLPPRFDAIVTYCDPSLSGKATADYKAIITLGLANNRYYILDAWIRKASINSMLLYLYDLDRRFATRIFMEANLWQKVLWEFIPPLSESQGYLLPVAGVENRLPKDQRIEALTPLFEWGWILLPPGAAQDVALLREQLLGFPDFSHDDGPDALAGAVDAIKNFGRPLEYRSFSLNKSNIFAGL
ncbi:MAG TPA: phage terminase large subunit [Candidatus Syntrophosphaera sp.]|nr:phage terminase large subunit [Candidatus Syntrophosphaera sp.]